MIEQPPPLPNPLPRLRGRGDLLLAAVLSLASVASAQTTQPTLSASLGFDGVFKPDNWSPVYVTLADDQRREGTIELRVAHGRLGHDVVARVVANPRAATYTLYAPLGSLDRASLQFRDVKGELIAARDLSDAVQRTPAAFGGFAVGVSGELAAARRVVGDFVRDTGEYASAGAVATRLLPERAIGYRAVDALVIAGIDTDAMDDGVERAIADWVRAGGVLVTWPGAQRPTRLDSPLAALMPADEGELLNIRVEGNEVIARSLARRDGPAIGDLSADGATTFRRRVGLGQVVLTNVDPTSLPTTSPVARLARWRRLFEDQFSLLPDDRRKGVFDPLVAQSVAEQSVRGSAPATDWRPLWWAALVAGLLLGPGEIVMLAMVRQHPRSPYTLAGLAIVVVSGVASVTMRNVSAGDTAVTLRVVTPDGAAATASTTLGASVATRGTTWLTGDAGDPTRQPAGAARIAQREGRFITSPTWLSDGAARPLLRTIIFATEVETPTMQPTATAIARPREAVIDGKTIAADDPATVRVETGIERLAVDPTWAAVFLDRTIASRLVRLQESEGATITASRDGASIVLRVER